jgi:hypothetical protein
MKFKKIKPFLTRSRRVDGNGYGMTGKCVYTPTQSMGAREKQRAFGSVLFRRNDIDDQLAVGIVSRRVFDLPFVRIGIAFGFQPRCFQAENIGGSGQALVDLERTVVFERFGKL